MNETIIQFDPTVEALHAIVKKTKNITATDLEDKSQLEVVKRNRLDIGKARITIEKRGKELRADALKFQKNVIAKEKELLDIINPEEDRLKQIEKDAEVLALKKERLEQLPKRKEILATNGVSMEDDVILTYDNNMFQHNMNILIAEKNRLETERIEAEKAQLEQDKIKAEQVEKERLQKIEEEKIEADRKEVERLAKIKQEETDRLDRIKKEEDDRLAKIEAEKQQAIREQQIKEQAEKDALAKIEREKIQKEIMEQLAKEELEKNNKYNEFKAQYQFDKEENTGTEIILWKKVATYPLK